MVDNGVRRWNWKVVALPAAPLFVTSIPFGNFHLQPEATSCCLNILAWHPVFYHALSFHPPLQGVVMRVPECLRCKAVADDGAGHCNNNRERQQMQMAVVGRCRVMVSSWPWPVQ